MMELMKTILERRSIRKYTGGPVSREQLLTLARAGMAAPSSRDTRHFRFVLIDDPAVVDRLTAGLPYAKMLATARHAVVVASDLSVAHGGGETGLLGAGLRGCGRECALGRPRAGPGRLLDRGPSASGARGLRPGGPGPAGFDLPVMRDRRRYPGR